MSTILSREQTVYKDVLGTALATHDKLNSDDIRFGTHILLQALSTDESVATAVLHMYKLTNTGRFCMLYNLDLDMHIKERKHKRVKSLATASTQTAFPELYTNSELSEEDIKTIQSISNKEYHAILQAIQAAITSSVPISVDILPRYNERDSGKNSLYSLYSQYYRDICVYESNYTGKYCSSSDIPFHVYIIDNSEGEPKSYCLDVMHVISAFAKGNYKKNKCNHIFSDQSKKRLHAKYDKEIKLYRRYLAILTQASKNHTSNK